MFRSSPGTPWSISRRTSLGIVLVFICSCDSPSPPKIDLSEIDLTERNAADGSDAKSHSRELVTKLLDTKSVKDLESLLQVNGVDSTRIRRVGTMTVYRPGSTDLPTVIRDAARVQSNGKTFTIASAIVESHKRGNLPTLPETPIVYVFDEDGRIISSFGSRDYSAKHTPIDIDVLTFGASNTWFILVERSDPSGIGDHRYSDIYLLADPIEKVFQARHFHGSMEYTGTEEQAAHSGAFVGFRQTKSGRLPNDSNCVAADGSLQRPRIDWIAEERGFRGPSKMTFEGEDLFEINLLESKRYRATDVTPQTPK